MQTLPRVSFKNNYFYQILIILADILTQTYNFMMKSPEASRFLLGKTKDVMFLFLYHTFGFHFLEAIKQ